MKHYFRLIGEVAAIIAVAAGYIASIVWMYFSRLHAAKAAATAKSVQLRCNLTFTHCVFTHGEMHIHWWTQVLLPTVGLAIGIPFLALAVFGVKDIWRKQELEAEASQS